MVYGHLLGYLYRWKLFELGRFMVRIHKILDMDQTPFLHNHPFSYISIVLNGGYDEILLDENGNLKTIHRKAGSIVYRSNKQFHRIETIHGECTTLFLTWKTKGNEQNWTLKRHPLISAPPLYNNPVDGVYKHDGKFRMRKDGMWYALRETISEAMECNRLSIHQNLNLKKPIL